MKVFIIKYFPKKTFLLSFPLKNYPSIDPTANSSKHFKNKGN